jgi:hypothetical protein
MWVVGYIVGKVIPMGCDVLWNEVDRGALAGVWGRGGWGWFVNAGSKPFSLE